MPEGSRSIEDLEAQISAISDTQDNLAGLIQKAARIQGELLDAGFSEYSETLGEPFTAMSMAAEKLQELVHDMEIERNRMRNEE